MTLNGLIALILLLAIYVTVFKDRPIMSVKYCLQSQFQFRP